MLTSQLHRYNSKEYIYIILPIYFLKIYLFSNFCKHKLIDKFLFDHVNWGNRESSKLLQTTVTNLVSSYYSYINDCNNIVSSYYSYIIPILTIFSQSFEILTSVNQDSLVWYFNFYVFRNDMSMLSLISIVRPTSVFQSVFRPEKNVLFLTELFQEVKKEKSRKRVGYVHQVHPKV